MTKEVLEAVKTDNLALAEELLKTGEVNVDWCDERGVTLLQFAADAGKEAMVSLLLKAGADPNGEGEIDRTPLHCAVSRGHTAVIKRLLEAGADTYRKNRYGYTPIDVATHNKRNDLIQLLKAPPTKLSDSIALTAVFSRAAVNSVAKDIQKEVIRTEYCSIL